MKITVDTKALREAAGLVARAIAAHSRLDALKCVRLVVDADGLTLSATDLDRLMSVSLAGEVEGEWRAQIDARRFLKFVQLVRAERVEIERTERGVSVLAGSAVGRFVASEPYDYPFGRETPQSFEIEATHLRALFAGTAFAISTEETRYYLNGVHLTLSDAGEPPSLRAVATDGHRLAIMDAPRPEGLESLPSIILPTAAVDLAQRMLAGVEGPVQVAVGEGRLDIFAGGRWMAAKLIDGSFPDWRRVMPTAHAVEARLDAKAMLAAARLAASGCSRERAALRLDLSEQGVAVSTDAPPAAPLDDVLSMVVSDRVAARVVGPDVTVGLNHRYLLELLTRLRGEITLRASDGCSPMLIESDGGLRAVIMPMRIDGCTQAPAPEPMPKPDAAPPRRKRKPASKAAAKRAAETEKTAA